MTLEGIGELGLLERIKPYLSAGAGGDDAAVIADATGFVVASTDMFVEGVHFDFGWMSAEDVGWRSLALALGDLAAKGAQPLWALTSIAMPNRWPVWTRPSANGSAAAPIATPAKANRPRMDSRLAPVRSAPMVAAGPTRSGSVCSSRAASTA